MCRIFFCTFAGFDTLPTPFSLISRDIHFGCSREKGSVTGTCPLPLLPPLSHRNLFCHGRPLCGGGYLSYLSARPLCGQAGTGKDSGSCLAPTGRWFRWTPPGRSCGSEADTAALVAHQLLTHALHSTPKRRALDQRGTLVLMIICVFFVPRLGRREGWAPVADPLRARSRPVFVAPVTAVWKRSEAISLALRGAPSGQTARGKPRDPTNKGRF